MDKCLVQWTQRKSDNSFLQGKYTDTSGSEYLSVTTLIGNYVEPFNEKYWAHRKAKEQGRSEKSIKAEWNRIKNEACSRGSETHEGIEHAIKSVSKFQDAIQYLNKVKTGRQITVADIPSLKAVPLDVEKFKEATDNKYPEIYRNILRYIEFLIFILIKDILFILK